MTLDEMIGKLQELREQHPGDTRVMARIEYDQVGYEGDAENDSFRDLVVSARTVHIYKGTQYDEDHIFGKEREDETCEQEGGTLIGCEKCICTEEPCHEGRYPYE